MKFIRKRLLSAVLAVAVCLLMLIPISADTDNGDSYYRYQGYSNLYLTSMISGGDADGAFELAEQDIYVPAGEYVIKKPIFLDNASLVGAGMDKTVIIADFENPNTPIVIAGATSSIENIQFRYKDGLVTGEEARGQRVGLCTGNYWELCKGAVIKNVKFSNVGTGMYAPDSLNVNEIGVVTNYNKEDLPMTAFSITFDNIVIEDFSYRGIDFSADTRTGNIYRGIYLSSGKYACNSAFYFDGEESETSIDSITVADTRAERPIFISGARALDAGAINLRNVNLIGDNLTYIYFEKSSGNIKHLSLNKTAVKSVQNLVQIGDTQFVNEGFDVLASLNIGKLTFSDVSGMKLATGFKYFKRKSGCTTPFYITVESYYYNAQQLEKDTYRSFPTSDENLIYTKKGQITEKGSTIMRPENRLCPFYTKYEDTDLGKTLIWNGEEWQ